jgi:archaellum component FlaF (FlaF/FlaG flagellin family)
VLILTVFGSAGFAQVLKAPYIIYPGVNTEMQVLWQDSGTQTDTVSWGLSASSLGYPVNVLEQPAPAGANTSKSGYMGHQHIYTISGLTPNTKYYYQVVDGSNQQAYPGSFITAPLATDTKVRFIAQGDSRSQPAFLDALDAAIMKFIAQPGNSDYQRLSIANGDWVSTDGESYWTSQWFMPTQANVRKYTANAPVDGVKGNHDNASGYSATFPKYYPMPYPTGSGAMALRSGTTDGNGNPYYNNLFWSMDYGPVHFTFIDEYSSMAVGSTQYNWVVSDLAKTTKPWKIVVYHEPAYSAGADGDNTAVQVFEGAGGAADVLGEYGVDMTFSGHSHNYARAGVYNAAQANGDPITLNLPHITSGGGGAPIYQVDLSNDADKALGGTPWPHVIVGWPSLEFMTFDVEGNTLQVTAYQVNNAVTNESLPLSAAFVSNLSISPIETLTLHHFTEKLGSSIKVTSSCNSNSTSCSLTLKNNGGAVTGPVDVLLDGMLYLQGLGNANAQYVTTPSVGVTNGVNGGKIAKNAACGIGQTTGCLITNVTLLNATGSHNGEPLIRATSNGLAAGASVTVPLNFSGTIDMTKINPIVYQE